MSQRTPEELEVEQRLTKLLWAARELTIAIELGETDLLVKGRRLQQAMVWHDEARQMVAIKAAGRIDGLLGARA